MYDAADITRSSISGNSAARSGGGVWAFDLTLDDSTLSSNSSSEGSAITTFYGLTMGNSTIVGNTSTATEAGSTVALFGGQFVSSIHNSTFSGNSAMAPCSEIRSQTSATTMDVSSTIIKGQCGASVLSLSPITVAGDHDILDPAGSSATLPADNLNCDPQVLPLADNGGPTLTAALGTGSCAIDHGIESGCSAVRPARRTVCTRSRRGCRRGRIRAASRCRSDLRRRIRGASGKVIDYPHANDIVEAEAVEAGRVMITAGVADSRRRRACRVSASPLYDPPFTLID